jgi:tyrosine-protein kinase Etk/Wzc
MTVNNQMNTLEFQEEESSVNLRDLLQKYIIHWRWFLFSLLFFIFLGYTYVKLATPLYKIETDLLIKDNKGNLGDQQDLLKDLDLFSSDKIIDNEIEILKSNTILEKTVRGLNLQTSYYVTKGVRKREIYNHLPFKVELLKPVENLDYDQEYIISLISPTQFQINSKKYAVNQPVQTEVGLMLVTVNPLVPKTPENTTLNIKFRDVRAVVEAYSNLLNINANSKQGTVLIITIEDAIPQKGKDFLNRLVLEYNKAAIEDKNKVTAATLKFITERLNKLQEELGTAEKKVENFKSGNQITDISSQSQIFLQNVQVNDVALSKVNIQLSVLKNIENYLASHESRAQIPSMLGIEDPTLLALVSQLGEVQLKKNSLLQTIPETNPIITSLNDQISSLRSGIDQSVKNLTSGLQITKRQLDNKNASFQSVISDVPSKERGLLDVMRQQEIKNSLFTQLLQKREETEISLAATSPDSRTIDEANSSRFPVKPVKQLTLSVFVLFGLLVPIGIIYIRDMLNFKVSRRSDIERVTNVPILAEISHSTDVSALLVVSRPRSMVAEQLRALRTNINFVMPQPGHKVMLFTSNISGEGKSFISLNLGASLAMSDKKVVILELDLRKPKLHAGLEIINDKGLSNYLIGEVDYKDIIRKVPQQDNYFIITCGPIPPNPAELLVNGKINALIQKLKEDFDYILLDAPPVGLVTDAQILAEYADATLFIVRHNYTAKTHINSINNFYLSKRFKNLNIVLNSIDIAGGYGYGYGYGYSYDGGYYQEDAPTRKKSIQSKILKS